MTNNYQHVFVVVTDFGSVRLSGKTIAWLRSVDLEWSDIAHNKRRRGKRAAYVREQVRRLEEAVKVAADISWASGDVLEEF